ncbi:MAG: hypothetical protein WCA31_09065 [Acidimicrobiales bacterium]
MKSHPRAPFVKTHERSFTVATMLSGLALLSTTVLTTTGGAAASPTTVTVFQYKSWGALLTLKNGDTLYRLSKDSKNKSVCTGQCLTYWTPVVLSSGQKTPIGVGVSHLGTFIRTGGGHQVTYEGVPLYTFTGDLKPHQVNGNNVIDSWGHWWAINPSSPTTPPTKKGSNSTTTTTSSGYGY